MTAGKTELQQWYLGRLRPRVAEAVRAGVVPAAAAAALDRQVTQLLELPPEPRSAGGEMR